MCRIHIGASYWKEVAFDSSNNLRKHINFPRKTKKKRTRDLKKERGTQELKFSTGKKKIPHETGRQTDKRDWISQVFLSSCSSLVESLAELILTDRISRNCLEKNLFNFGQSWNKFERSSRHSSASNGKLSASSWLRMNEHTAHCSPHFVECTLCAATLSLTLKRFFPFCCYCAAATTMKSIHAIDISTKKYAVYTSLSLSPCEAKTLQTLCCGANVIRLCSTTGRAAAAS